MFIGHIQTIEYGLIIILCLQTGVFDFIESLSISALAYVVFTGFFIFQYFIERENIELRPVIQFFGFLSFTCFLLCVNVFIQIRSQIENFNSKGIGAKRIDDMVDFIERLMPKHMRMEIKN